MALPQADIDRIADAVALRLPTVQVRARAVAVELRRNKSEVDEIAHAARTMTIPELKKYMKEREG